VGCLPFLCATGLLLVLLVSAGADWCQVGILQPGRALLTVVDLADTGRRMALYYDGEHHLGRTQRDTDSLITAQLAAWGGGACGARRAYPGMFVS
jgi:hypothetical protein